MSSKAIHYHRVAREVLALLQKDYTYDASDNLVAEALTQTQQRGGSGTLATMPANDECVIGRFAGLGQSGSSYTAGAHYGYNPNEQIQSAYRSSPQMQGKYIEGFNYDKAGNLLDGYRISGHIKHNRVHVYQDKRYRYDRFGRLSEKRTGSSCVQRFEYDAEHRLVCVLQQKGALRERVVFGYDPLGRRISKGVYRDGHTQPSRRTLFHWQGLRLLQEEQDGKPSLYVYADAGSYEPLARLDGKPGCEEFFYFHTNLAGLPEQLTDAEGVTVWHSEYQTWGKSREEWRSAQQTREQNLRFQGQYLDRETGLHYNTFRFFDPEVGRFTQADPIGLAGGLNLYAYGKNPLTWIDPQGLDACDVIQAKGRKDALRRAQQHAQVPRISRGGEDIELNRLNESSRGVGWAKMKANGAKKLGRRNPKGNNKWSEHPDGHPDAGQPKAPKHHDSGHIHATDTTGKKVVFTW